MTTILRARIAHTPRDPFLSSGALETFDDGAVAFDEGTILATGRPCSVTSTSPPARTRARYSLSLAFSCATPATIMIERIISMCPD